MLKGISFQVLRAEYENPFLAYTRLYLGMWIFSAESCIVAGVMDLRWYVSL